MITAIAQQLFLSGLAWLLGWGKKELASLWEKAKTRVLELEKETSLTGKEKAARLTSELKKEALRLSPDATDAIVDKAMSSASPFLSQTIEILIPFAVIVARAQSK